MKAANRTSGVLQSARFQSGQTGTHLLDGHGLGNKKFRKKCDSLVVSCWDWGGGVTADIRALSGLEHPLH